MPAILRHLRYLRCFAMSRVAAFSFLPLVPLPLALIYGSGSPLRRRGGTRRDAKERRTKRNARRYAIRARERGKEVSWRPNGIWKAMLDSARLGPGVKQTLVCYRVSQIPVEQGQTVELAISSPPCRQVSLTFLFPLPIPKHGPRWHGMNVQLALAPGFSAPSLVPSISSKLVPDPSI